MTSSPGSDPSHGYEGVAEQFMAHRTGSGIGASTVREWASGLPAGAVVLDLGCGHGVPISQVLIEAGATVCAVDASPTMTAAFRRRFPHASVECAGAEYSDFFGRTFDGVVAWGLLFLLPAPAQTAVIRRVAQALKPGGRFLFTAPWQACEWTDEMTGEGSLSLGRDVYRETLEEAGLSLVGEADDEGGNHYYLAERPTPSDAPV